MIIELQAKRERENLIMNTCVFERREKIEIDTFAIRSRFLSLFVAPFRVKTWKYNLINIQFSTFT